MMLQGALIWNEYECFGQELGDIIVARIDKLMQSVDCAKRIALEENRKQFEKHDCELRTIFSNLERNLLDEKRDLLTYASNFQSKVECSKNTKGNRSFGAKTKD